MGRGAASGGIGAPQRRRSVAHVQHKLLVPNCLSMKMLHGLGGRCTVRKRDTRASRQEEHQIRDAGRSAAQARERCMRLLMSPTQSRSMSVPSCALLEQARRCNKTPGSLAMSIQSWGDQSRVQASIQLNRCTTCDTVAGGYETAAARACFDQMY